MEQLQRRAPSRGEPHRLPDHGLADAARGLLRVERREVLVDRAGLDHRRAHQRQDDGADAHRPPPELQRERAREVVQRGLGGDVAGEVRRACLHTDARHVHDVAAAPREHAGQQAQREPERAQIVDRERALEVLRPVERGLDGAPDREARVVDQHVDGLGGARQRLQQLAHLRGLGEVGAQRLGAGAEPAHLRERALEPRRVARDQHQVCARLRELVCERAADPGGGAGDQHGAAGDGAAQALGVAHRSR